MLITQAGRFFISDFQVLKWKVAFDKLEGLFQLKDNWDGEDASKPAPELITAAKKWLTKYNYKNQTNNPPSKILASPDGEVVFQWVTSSSREQIEFLSPYRAEWTFIRDNFETQHEFIDLTDFRKAEKITISNYYQNSIDSEETELFYNPKIPNENIFDGSQIHNLSMQPVFVVE